MLKNKCLCINLLNFIRLYAFEKMRGYLREGNDHIVFYTTLRLEGV